MYGLASVEYGEVRCRTALSKSRLPDLDYALNPYVGCEHGCLYCYARATLRDEAKALRWGRFVLVKKGLVERLAREVLRKPKGVVGLSTVTDPYQPIEARLRLTRRCLEILVRKGFPVSIQTKSKLVLRDLDLIKAGKVDVGMTITTMDDSLASMVEPRSSRPSERAEALRRLAEEGVETWVFLGPIIPRLNDSEESIRRVVEVAYETGSELIVDKLNLRKWVLESLAPLLDRLYPGLKWELPDMLRPGSSYLRELYRRVERICRSYGIEYVRFRFISGPEH
ncbi:MAG: hypothetical protein AYL29_014080 [Candidatus Bathyarchaeota archaeon B24]|nr:MAG: hypothetical protein AYL29_014080 [Candidatus Bathyarchaeota archaeon B24]